MGGSGVVISMLTSLDISATEYIDGYDIMSKCQNKLREGKGMNYSFVN